MKRTITAGAIGVVAALAIVSGAFAAKPPATLITVDCGDGAFQVLDWGNGGNNRFKPVHIVETHEVVIPVAFRNVEGVFGGVPFTDDDDSRHAPANVDLWLDCHFSSIGDWGSVEGDVDLYIPGK